MKVGGALVVNKQTESQFMVITLFMAVGRLFKQPYLVTGLSMHLQSAVEHELADTKLMFCTSSTAAACIHAVYISPRDLTTPYQIFAQGFIK